MMKRLRLTKRPQVQLLIARAGLRVNYGLPPRTEIILEGAENIPADRPVFLAMNHTDRYNYWPLQYGLWRRGSRFTATWVKGKYFESRWMARFMIATNNIPLPSRGYVISIEFRRAMGRVPDAAEYRLLRDLADGTRVDAAGASETVRRFLDDGGLARFEEVFRAMTAEVTRLTRQAIQELNLDVLVFPQGTRSIRLTQGHTGLAQMSQHLGTAIVPIGCNGSDKVYPGSSPWAKGGRIVYRIGAPLEPTGPELAPHRVTDPFEPLLPEATRAHGAKLRAITDIVMAKIDALLDPPYKAAPDGIEGGTKDMDRFV
jgi:1-acyl-sn-glycerol-3-phosphate acyltransferase